MEKNPGNPFTIHKNKYKQNWPYDHFMDGDHMNINPFGPQFQSLGPSGPELFFGRKWWYFNQLQNILDCDGLSLTDQLIRLLQYRRDIDYPEDYQIWVESRSAEEKSEEALSREEEAEDEQSEYVAATQEEDAVDEPAEYVAVDKPVARVIRDYYKLEQEKKKKKMQMERALLEPQEMHPYVEIMPPPPPPPPERQYEQVRQELYQPPRPVQPPPVRPRLQQNPVKIKPRYVKPKAKDSSSKFRYNEHYSTMEPPTAPLTELPSKSNVETSDYRDERPTNLNKSPISPYHKVARSGDNQKNDTENATDTDSQIMDLLGIDYVSDNELTNSIDSLRINNDTANSLQLQDDLLKDVDWNKHRRQTDLNVELSNCYLVIVPASTTNLEPKITKLLKKYKTAKNKKQVVTAIACSKMSNIVLLEANEIITDLILTLASSGQISCQCRRNYSIRRMNPFFESVKRPIDIGEKVEYLDKHKFKNIAPENIILRSHSKDPQSDDVSFKKKLLATLKNSKETEVDAALISEIFPDAQISSKNEFRDTEDGIMIYKGILSQKPEATKSIIENLNIASIYAKGEKARNDAKLDETINERRTPIEQSVSIPDTKVKIPARMQLLKIKD
ncbi:hypothetical protein B5X24_HaOG201568 [Helicoverpa armigera]|nr:hypothetical protein B5X24_HaOG201568 [Helicoverpa armigera]